MAKLLEKRLTQNKAYVKLFGDRNLTEAEIQQLYKFNEHVGYSADRLRFLIECIDRNISDWITRWDELKKYPSGSLKHQCIRYGDEEGLIRYNEINKKKTVGFDHSPATQRARAKKSAEISRGNKEWSPRGMGFWIKRGYTEAEATAYIKEIQKTNTVENYIKKYGPVAGPEKFEERKINWIKQMDDPKIHRKRSLGLTRYIERYGAIEGERAYINMRKKRNEISSIGRASIESILALQPIIDILEKNDILYYMGIPNNHEWCIYNSKQKRPFFYDLTIPRLSVIIEYHGEGFHPNPKWDNTKLSMWKQAITNKSSAEIMCETEIKNSTAKENGWELFEVFSSEVQQTIPIIIDYIAKLGHC